ncbi:MAG: nickel-dependent lactate racemase, partial [Acidimicrobiales bacterium]
MRDPAGALREALRSPVGSPPLRQLARRGQRVAISVCDITRAQPRRLMVPAILAELDGVVRPEDVIILVATGTHRANSPEELAQMLGRDTVSRCQVLNHDSRDPSILVGLGWADDVPCELNRHWVEADLRITTGFVEPHFFAGFSGGPKMVAPGLAGLETVLALHDSRRIGSPLATWGVIEGNPVQDGLRAVTRMAPPHLSLDVVLNTRQEITQVFAGELFATHALACAEAKAVAMRPVDKPFDVVVTSNSGYPLDQNLYQSVKGMSAANAVVKEDGLIVCAAECRDGLPDHGSYARVVASRSTPGELLDMIEAPGYRAPDQWQVQLQAKIQCHARVAFKSSFLEPAQLRS